MNFSQDNRGPRPYNFVKFSDKKPITHYPPGHDKYKHDYLHGTLFISLEAQTQLHVSTGIVMMGSDIEANDIPLIKTMVQGENGQLLIQGSSLKGCVRSIYETITNSRLGVKPQNPNECPEDFLPVRNKERHELFPELCPAAIVFGADGDKWGWQGLLAFQDAHCQQTDYQIGFMSNLWSPKPEVNPIYYDSHKKLVGRKFYYNMTGAIDKGLDNGIPVQVALQKDIFSTQITFKNLSSEHLGALLVALGQDEDKPLNLKIGAAKPLGFGTIKVTVDKIRVYQNQNHLRQRYTSLKTNTLDDLTDEKLEEFIEIHIQQAHERIIESSQLEQLFNILNPQTNRQPYEQY